jgi:hypothetical protein
MKFAQFFAWSYNKHMNTQEKAILQMFRGKIIGGKTIKKYVCKVLSFMPSETIEFITDKCWFMGSFDDAFGYAFKGDDLAGQFMIFLSDDLFAHSENQIKYTIAHEIGHVVLGHRNAVFEQQSKADIALQEKEADGFAKKYI